MRGNSKKALFGASLAAASIFISAPLAAEVVETSATGFVTRDTVRVATTPLETWLALIKPGDWWNDNHSWSGDASNMTLVPQAGGCFCERIPGDDANGGFAMDGSSTHMTVIQAFPLRVLRMRGGLGPLQGEPATGILTITLKEIEGGTRVLWEYNVGGPMRFEIDEISAAVDGVMSEQLRGLQSHLGALDGEDEPGPAEGAGPPESGESATPPDEASEPSEEGEASLEEQIDALANDE
ncbi:SRPBCC family protein [Erythrobacter sp. W53]|uniref:SRPBCC family protein n=1 Tax=Erythrobacter sp. W53 TaxID=3425947 RepID=UPI003D766F52